MFIYIAGIIGWSGREYVRAVRGKKNAAEYEIIIDTDLAWQCLKRGAAWPLQANRAVSYTHLTLPTKRIV